MFDVDFFFVSRKYVSHWLDNDDNPELDRIPNNVLQKLLFVLRSRTTFEPNKVSDEQTQNRTKPSNVDFTRFFSTPFDLFGKNDFSVSKIEIRVVKLDNLTSLKPRSYDFR